MKLKLQAGFFQRIKTAFFKSRLITLPLLLHATGSLAQTNHVPVFFVELGGNGGLVSVNYDQRFAAAKDGFGFRLGVGAGATPGTHVGFGATLTAPVAVNYLLGKGPHQLEAGAGVTFGAGKFSPSGESISSKFFVPSIGYRYLSAKRGGFMFRAFVCPFIASKTEISGGISFGVRL